MAEGLTTSRPPAILRAPGTATCEEGRRDLRCQELHLNFSFNVMELSRDLSVVRHSSFSDFR